MIVCSICTGRHHPLGCRIATRFVDECLSGTPDDYQPVEPVAVLFDLDAYRRNLATARTQRYRDRVRERRHA